MGSRKKNGRDLPLPFFTIYNITIAGAAIMLQAGSPKPLQAQAVFFAMTSSPLSPVVSS